MRTKSALSVCTVLLCFSFVRNGIGADRTYVNSMGEDIRICLKPNQAGSKWRCSKWIKDGQSWQVRLVQNVAYHFAIQRGSVTERLGLKVAYDSTPETFRFVKKTRVKRIEKIVNGRRVIATPLEEYIELERATGSRRNRSSRNSNPIRLGVTVHKCSDGIHIDSIDPGSPALLTGLASVVMLGVTPIVSGVSPFTRPK